MSGPRVSCSTRPLHASHLPSLPTVASLGFGSVDDGFNDEVMMVFRWLLMVIVIANGGYNDGE